MLRNYRKRSLSLKIYQHVKRTSITESTNLAKDINRFHISSLNVNNIETHNYYISTLFCCIYEYFHNNRRGEEEGWYIFKGRHSASHDPFRRTKNGTASARWWKKKERKRERKKCIHGHPPTSTSSYVKKERPALFQPFPLTTSPANAGGGGGGAGERKVTVHFFPGFIFPAPNPSVCH